MLGVSSSILEILRNTLIHTIFTIFNCKVAVTLSETLKSQRLFYLKKIAVLYIYFMFACYTCFLFGTNVKNSTAVNVGGIMAKYPHFDTVLLNYQFGNGGMISGLYIRGIKYCRLT